MSDSTEPKQASASDAVEEPNESKEDSFVGGLVATLVELAQSYLGADGIVTVSNIAALTLFMLRQADKLASALRDDQRRNLIKLSLENLQVDNSLLDEYTALENITNLDNMRHSGGRRWLCCHRPW
jgi:hypothetical protein